MTAVLSCAAACSASPTTPVFDASDNAPTLDAQANDVPSTADTGTAEDGNVDANGINLPECWNVSFEPREVARHHVTERFSADQRVYLGIWRCPTTVGFTYRYRMDRFELRTNDNHWIATAESIFDYRVTHHNWMDSARIETHDGHTIFWRTSTDGGAEHIEVRRGETLVLETTLLERMRP